MTTAEVKLLLDCKNLLGESVVWDPNRKELLWVNIHDGELWAYRPADCSVRLHRLPERVGCIGLRRGGGLVVGLASGFALYDLDTEVLERLCEVERDLPTTRLNDGRTDRQGRFVCGGMDEGEPQRPFSAVYSLDGDRRMRRIIHGVRCANSICFSPDGTTMYFSDMPTGRILAYAYDTDSGTPHSPRVLADCSGMPGLPDGSTVDAEGFLWNAQWGGARLVRYAPDGRMERVVPLPVTNPTCPGFGGPDLGTLFVVSARFALRPQQLVVEPWAGGVFALDVGVRGLPECPFADA